MSDTTNDIDCLLYHLDNGYWPEKHTALTALIAERDRLRAELAAEKARAGDLSDEVKILRIYGNKDCTSMADPAIDALLRMLEDDGWENHHAALTALVAERDELRKRVPLEVSDTWARRLVHKDQIINGLRHEHELQEKQNIADRLAVVDLKRRVAELEKELLVDTSAMLAAMRKGATDGK